MDNSPISVKDLILSDDDFTVLTKGKKQLKSEYTYHVIMESGCDFAVERREKGKKRTSRFVVLVSQGQGYIEENGTRKKLTAGSLRSFLGGLKKDERIQLPNVNWIDHLRSESAYCNCILEIIGENKRGSDVLAKMIKHGLFALVDFIDADIVRSYRFRFGDERVSYLDRVYFNDFAPYENRINDPFGVPGPMYDHENMQDTEALVENPFNPGYAIRFYGGYNPVRTGDSMLIRYYQSETTYYQQTFYDLSPALYRYMIQMMVDRRSVTVKELLCRYIFDWNTKESLLFQSFVSFVLIEYAFGIEAARKVMEGYMDSGISDIIPYKQMSYLLFGTNFEYMDHADIICGEGHKLREMKSIYNMKSSAFMKYLLEESVRQGYGCNMNLFLYQWGQYLLLQKYMKIKGVDKYPEHLASRTVEVMSMVAEHQKEIEENVWIEAREFAAPLEYKDEKYQIIVPRCSADLMREAEQQRNCVGTYESRILRRETRICFLRSADPELAERSLVTIEVDDDGNVLQCKGKCNTNPPDEKWKFIMKWEAEKGLSDVTGMIPDHFNIGLPNM